MHIIKFRFQSIIAITVLGITLTSIFVLITRQQTWADHVKSDITYNIYPIPRLRGAVVGPDITSSDIYNFGRKWNANFVRWQLRWDRFLGGPSDSASIEEYNSWLQKALKHLDKLLPAFQKAGIWVVIDLHTPPGGRDAKGVCRVFEDTHLQSYFIKTWAKIAQRYADYPSVWGFDLLNEPVEPRIYRTGLRNWSQLAQQTGLAIRKYDKRKKIIVEGAPWGGPEALWNLKPLKLSGVIYSIHMYQPAAFTLQGVNGRPRNISYPGWINGIYWDKNRLRDILDKAREFQIRYGVSIYVGEFSAVRWAPDGSAYRYIRDCIDIFEEYKWNWTYHAFHEWQGWSVEYDENASHMKKSKKNTARKMLLLKWFRKNMHPSFKVVN